MPRVKKMRGRTIHPQAIAKREPLEARMVHEGYTCKTLSAKLPIGYDQFLRLKDGAPTSAPTARSICRLLKTKFDDLFRIETNGE